MLRKERELASKRGPIQSSPLRQTVTPTVAAQNNDDFVPTPSMVNLTKPQLYSLYDEEITDPKESKSLYNIVNTSDRLTPDVSSDGAVRSSVGRTSSVSPMPIHSRVTFLGKLRRYVANLVVLSVCGIIYFEISKNLHDNHQLHPDFIFRPIVVIIKLLDLIFEGQIPEFLQNYWVVFAIEGILFGCIIRFLDIVAEKLRFSDVKSRNERERSGSIFSILRLVNAMFGVTFGIRKIQWQSSLQASGAWGLLNFVLWLFFDGSVSLLVNSLLASCGITFTCWYELMASDSWELAQFLYLWDFYFLGFLIFGRISRYMSRTA